MASRVPELSMIEFTGSESVRNYAEELRSLFREITMELEFSHEALYAILSRQEKGHPLLLGLDVKFKAKMVQRRMKRCKELANGGAIEAVKIWAEYQKQFAEVIRPQRQPQKAWHF